VGPVIFTMCSWNIHFDVEPWLIEHRIGYLRRKARENGQKVKWRGLIRRVWMVKRSEAGQRISNIIRQNKIEHEKYKRKKMFKPSHHL
jgi:hypothetical protein